MTWSAPGKCACCSRLRTLLPLHCVLVAILLVLAVQRLSREDVEDVEAADASDVPRVKRPRRVASASSPLASVLVAEAEASASAEGKDASLEAAGALDVRHAKRPRSATNASSATAVAGEHVGPRKGNAKKILVAQGGHQEKFLVVYMHFHATAGKVLCAWARRAHQIKDSGIVLSDEQLVSAACNIVDPDPPNEWLRLKIRTCRDLKRFSRRLRGTNWLFLETPLDVRPPCPGVAFVTVIRHPWSRMESTQGKLGWLFPNATRVMRSMHSGQDSLKASGWDYCPVAHAPTCNGFFRAGYFDNFFIRFLLGPKEGAQIPWGHVNKAVLKKAKEILELFDLVIPLEFLADALPVLQCAVGGRYDLGLDGTPGGRYLWPTERKRVAKLGVDNRNGSDCQLGKVENQNDQDRLDFCRAFLGQNRLDMELYQWAVARWQSWDAGRCRNAT